MEAVETSWKRRIASGGVSVSARTLPNLLVVGVKKAGTSSLFEYLAQHPDICSSTVKETGYFSPLLRDNGSLGPLEHYAAFFNSCGDEMYRLEATPDYFYGGSRVIRAIAGTLPDPRIIVTLRDPVSRLWSHYRMKQRDQSQVVEGLSFAEYVRRCEETEVVGGRGSDEARGYAALAHGRYVDYAREWFDAFGDDFKVVFLETWSKQPHQSMRDIARWLHIDEEVVGSFDFSVTNPTVQYRSPRVAKVARTMYRPVIHLLHRHPSRGHLLRGMGRLRSFHDVVNPQRQVLDEPAQDTGTQKHLDDLYRDSNRRLGLDLLRRGYRDLPPWLRRALTEA